MKIKKEDIKGREWRFGLHLPVGPNGEDYHMVKEYVHLTDGRIVPNMRIIKDFKRPVGILKPMYRTYQDKKEHEPLDRLDVLMTTQSALRNVVATAVGRPWSKESLSELLVSPYIYAADVPSTAIMQRELYQKENKHITRGAYKNAAFDTETDVLYGTEEIIIGTMTMLPEAHAIIRRDYLNFMTDEEFARQFQDVVLKKLNVPHDEEFKKFLLDKTGQALEFGDMKITYELVDTEIEIVEKSFKWFHDRKPDWMSIWNMDFDVTKVLNACKKAGVDPKQILCDSMIPWDYRIARYKRGQTQKVAASGKAKPVAPYDQWHFLFLSASFVIVDAMSAFRLLRLGEQEERSYALDAILEKIFQGKIRKLRHPPADMYVKERWHQEMQANHKLVYIAYAIFDTVSMAFLDLVTKDLSHKLPGMANITSFDQCNSQPKRLRDAFYVFALEKHNQLVGSVGHAKDAPPPEVFPESEYGDDEEDDEDKEEEEAPAETLNRKGWVLTLASHLSAPGLKLLKDAPHVTTGIRAYTYDSDAVSSYPSCTQVGNVSRVTTRKEVVRIGNYEEDFFRRNNLNLVFGPTNAIEYTTRMFQAPRLADWLKMYDRDHTPA